MLPQKDESLAQQKPDWVNRQGNQKIEPGQESAYDAAQRSLSALDAGRTNPKKRTGMPMQASFDPF